MLKTNPERPVSPLLNLKQKRPAINLDEAFMLNERAHDRYMNIGPLDQPISQDEVWRQQQRAADRSSSSSSSSSSPARKRQPHARAIERSSISPEPVQSQAAVQRRFTSIRNFKASHNITDNTNSEAIIQDLLAERTSDFTRRADIEDKALEITFDQLRFVRRTIAEIQEFLVQCTFNLHFSPELDATQLNDVIRFLQDYEKELTANLSQPRNAREEKSASKLQEIGRSRRIRGFEQVAVSERFQPQAAVQPNASRVSDPRVIEIMISRFKNDHNRTGDTNEAIIWDLLAERASHFKQRDFLEVKRREITFDLVTFVRAIIAKIRQFQKIRTFQLQSSSELAAWAASPLNPVIRFLEDYEKRIISNLKANVLLQKTRNALEEEENIKLASKLPDVVLELTAQTSGINMDGIAPINEIIAATQTSVRPAVPTEDEAARAPRTAFKDNAKHLTLEEISLLAKIIDLTRARDRFKKHPGSLHAELAEIKCIFSIIADRRIHLARMLKTAKDSRDFIESNEIVTFPHLWDAMLDGKDLNITTIVTLRVWEERVVFHTVADFEKVLGREFRSLCTMNSQLLFLCYVITLALKGDADSLVMQRRNIVNPTPEAYSPVVEAQRARIETDKEILSQANFDDYLEDVYVCQPGVFARVISPYDRA